MARVAVAEDHPQVRKYLETLLRGKGHEVVSYPDGQAALFGISEGGFDLVLSDVQMPGFDGISLCSALRANYSKRELPIVLLSVLENEVDILRALEAGASDYLVKPSSPAQICAKVEHHLQAQGRGEVPQDSLPAFHQDAPAFPCEFAGYRLNRELGRGSSGMVYEAQRLRDGLPLAIKILDVEVAEDRKALARYFRELTAITHLDSPHVVGFVCAGFEANLYYLGMELLRGNTLRDRIMKELLSLQEAIAVATEIGSALAELHQHGLVHRDVKPGNIMQDRERLVLVDLGLVRGEDFDPITATGEFVGTTAFLPPEVVLGQGVDIRSDIYSLGVTLYWATSGTLPFLQKSVHDTLRRIASKEPAASLSALRPGLPPAFVAFVARLMDPDPQRRPQTPAELQDAVEDLLLELPL